MAQDRRGLLKHIPSRADITLLVILSLVLIFGVLAPAYVAGQASKDAKRLACLTVEANRHEIEALNAISRDLGLPHHDYPVPPETPECAELLSP